MSDIEKINIYVPENIGNTLEQDPVLFEITKKDGLTPNMNRFLGLILTGYYSSYIDECNRYLTRIENELRVSVSDPAERHVLAESILRNVILPDVPQRKGKRCKHISLKPTKETEPILRRIMTGQPDYVSQYLCRLLMSYCKKPLYERERIIYRSAFDRLEEACSTHRSISFSTPYDKAYIHHVTPWRIVTAQEEMFNYLLCQELDLNNKPVARTYRLSRITAPTFEMEQYEIDGSVAADLQRMVYEGPQYAIHNDIDTCVRLTPSGEISYKRIYTGRPKYKSIEPDGETMLYHFNCSADQIFLYFRRFSATDAEVLYPETIRNRMIEFHALSYGKYSVASTQTPNGLNADVQ